MKYLFLSIVFAFLNLSSYAAPNRSNSAIQQNITDQIEYPTFAKAEGIEGMVILSYKINEDNTISVLESNSNSEKLKQYVIDTISSIKLESTLANTDEIFYLQLNFRLL